MRNIVRDDLVYYLVGVLDETTRLYGQGYELDTLIQDFSVCGFAF